MPIIRTEPDSALHRSCEPVSDFEDAKRIAKELLSAVRPLAKFWNRWLGLAANQIGHPKRMIVLRNNTDKYEVMINPILTEKRIPFPHVERCYSVPGLYLVNRYMRVKVEYYDLEGNRHEKVLRGPSAIYQEIDHLDGILVAQRGLRLL